MGVGIQVEKLNAWYGKGQALYDINLKVAANHATALIGPSGCGKSTFIRCINRMHERFQRRVSRAGSASERSTPTTEPPQPSFAAAWAWCFRRQTLFLRCRFTTTWPRV